MGDVGDDDEEGKGKELEENGWDDEPCAPALIRPCLSCLEVDVNNSWEELLACQSSATGKLLGK